MKGFILSTVLLSPLVFQAQSGFENNSLWTIQVTHDGTQAHNIWYEQYRLNDSVQIGSKEYAVLYADSLSSSDTIGFMRSEGKKTFFKFNKTVQLNSGSHTGGQATHDTTEFLLYDFSLSVGDTINLRFDNRMATPSETKQWGFEVAETDSLHTVSGPRARFKLYLLDRDSSFSSSLATTFRECYGDTLYWIEGTGSSISPIYPVHGVNCMGIGEGWWFSTSCLHVGNQVRYQPLGQCKPLSTKINTLSTEIEVFPLPAREFLNVRVPQHSFSSSLQWQIISQQGLVLQSGVIRIPRQQLNISSLPSGIYLLRVFDQQEKLFTHKILIQ